MNEQSIAVLLADDADAGLTHDYFASVLESFKRTIEQKDYRLAFLNPGYENAHRKRYLEQMKEGYAGLLIACIDYRREEVKELLSGDFPIITIDCKREGVINVTSDNRGGIREMVDYICGMGHKRIACITGDDTYITNVRKQALLEACSAHGVEIPAEYLFQSEYRNREKAIYYTEELLRMEAPPSCILYSDDVAAVAGLEILRARGLEVPHDMSVAGYDGIITSSFYQPLLCTVKQDTAELGKRAAERMMALIEHPQTADRNDIEVPTSLIKGRTIARVYY